MKTYTKVARKTVGEDRIAICPKFGCESIRRIKPLKFSFLGFGKYPKCKKHHIPLVYVDERIGDFVDAALACFFDRAGLPPNELLKIINTKFPEELEAFVSGWIYCITVGRGARIVSRYMDLISNAYLKQLTKKQIKNLKKEPQSKTSSINQAIRKGMNEITNQYTRLLKHLRTHSEVLIELDQLKPLSKDFRKVIFSWQETILKDNEILHSTESKHKIPLAKAKTYYDQILNAGTCRCLLGLSPESKEVKKSKLTAFDRFSAYYDFYIERLTVKFTKSDIKGLCPESRLIFENNSGIITKYGKNYRISHSYMLSLSKYIYLKISHKGRFNHDELIHNVFNKLKTDTKSKFVEEKDFQEYIKNYIGDLIIIVNNFKDRKNNNESDLINMSLFAKSLLNNGISLNNKIVRLKQNLREIFLYLKEEIPEFKLEKIDKTNLKFDLGGKICGNCGSNKPYSQFHPRTDGGYKFICKDCYLEKTQISLYKKEYRLIQEMKNGHFKGKCANPECDIDFTKLPAIEIHHPKSKRFTWRLILKKRYDLVKKKLDETDKAIPLCRNCHSLTYKVFYSHYKDLINDRYIFVDESDNPRSAEEIDKEIKKGIERYGLINNYSYGKTKIKILGWLRKRSVINQLYNGKCANCGERDIGKLQFHHMDPTLKNTFKHRNPNFDHLNIWKTFILSDIKEAADRVIFEECICLCGNCHALITSKYFEKNSVEILNTEYFLIKNGKKTKFRLNGESFSENIVNFFNKLRNVCEREHQRIKIIKKNNDIQIKDQLRTRPKWQLTLLYIYFLVRCGKKNLFSLKELEYISGFSHSKTLHWVKFLFENNYLVIVNEKSKGETTYSINKRGMDEALRIIHDYKLTYEEGFLSFVKNLNYPDFS